MTSEKMMPETPHNETYDVSKLKKQIKNLETNPKKLEQFTKVAKGRALDIFESGELKKLIQPGSEVAYIGNGSGHVAQVIEQETDSEVKKFDITDLRTPDTKDDNFYIANARDLPLEDESSDVVFLSDMLHHCKNQEEILAEAKRVMKKGGKLILIEDTMPEKENPRARKMLEVIFAKIDDLFNLQSKKVNPHNYRSIKEWVALLEQHGMEAEDVRSWYWGISDFMPGALKSKRGAVKTVNEEATYQQTKIGGRSAGRWFESTRLVFKKN